MACTIFVRPSVRLSHHSHAGIDILYSPCYGSPTNAPKKLAAKNITERFLSSKKKVAIFSDFHSRFVFPIFRTFSFL